MRNRFPRQCRGRMGSFSALRAARAAFVVVAICFPNVVRADEQPPLVSRADEPQAAAAELFGVTVGETASEGITYYLAVNNAATYPYPTTTARYWVQVECVTESGDRFYYSEPAWGVLDIGEQDYGRFYLLKDRVVKVRYHWKLRPEWWARWHSSNWVTATPDHILYHVEIEWRGQNDYKRPIHKYEVPNS